MNRRPSSRRHISPTNMLQTMIALKMMDQFLRGRKRGHNTGRSARPAPGRNQRNRQAASSRRSPWRK